MSIVSVYIYVHILLCCFWENASTLHSSATRDPVEVCYELTTTQHASVLIFLLKIRTNLIWK